MMETRRSGEPMSETSPNEPEKPPKRPYKTPALVVYGDVRSLTNGGPSRPTEVSVQQPSRTLP
jgi:hypothetical protein